VQPGEGNMDHPIYFASKKLSQAENNYTTTEREGLDMIYVLQKFRHYLLGSHFKFFIYHSTLKYLVNKPVLEGIICRWLLLFQEFSFEVIVKPGRCNVGPNHLSKLESAESGGAVDDQLPNENFFQIEAIPEYIEDIDVFLGTGTYTKTYSTTHKRNMVFCAANYQLNVGKLYKLGLNNILRRCVLDHERKDILWECHGGVVGGHVGAKDTAQNVLQVRLWWAMLFNDAKEYVLSRDTFQRVGKLSH